MASEDLFEEDFSEEIITQLDQDYVVEDLDAAAQESTNKKADEDETIEVADASEATGSEEIQQGATKPKPSGTSASSDAKLFQLPLTRVRNIMKLDPDFHMASNEAVFVVTRATELFIECLAVESYTFTAQAKRKTVQKRDVGMAVSAVDSLMFLDGAINF